MRQYYTVDWDKSTYRKRNIEMAALNVREISFFLRLQAASLVTPQTFKWNRIFFLFVRKKDT